MGHALLKEAEALLSRPSVGAMEAFYSQEVANVKRLVEQAERETLRSRTSGHEKRANWLKFQKQLLVEQSIAEIDEVRATLVAARPTYRKAMAEYAESIEQVRGQVAEANQKVALADASHRRFVRKIGQRMLTALEQRTPVFEAMASFIEDEVLPALEARIRELASSGERRIVRMADRQFSPERQAAVLKRIRQPSPDTLDWGREVARHLEQQ